MKNFNDFEDIVYSDEYKDLLNKILYAHQIGGDVPPEMSDEDYQAFASAIVNMSMAVNLQILRSYHIWANNKPPIEE